MLIVKQVKRKKHVNHNLIKDIVTKTIIQLSTILTIINKEKYFKEK